VSGSDEEADERLLRHVSSRVVMVPIDAKDLQDAVDERLLLYESRGYLRTPAQS
jgi:hypothetical protein